MLRFPASILLSLLFFTSLAYDKKLANTGLLMSEALNKLENGDTTGALMAYQMIPREDTNYLASLLQRVNIYVNQGNYEASLKLIDHGLEYEHEDEYKFIVLKGSLYSLMEKYDSAVVVFTEGLRKYPYNHVMMYNSALAHKEMGKYDEYVALLKKTVNLYPFYASVHFEMGNLSKNENRVAQALMSYIMGILIEPDSERARAALGLIHNMANGDFEPNDTPYEFPEGQDDYSEIDRIIKSRVALHKKYKIQSKADLLLIRQIQAMFEKLEYKAEDKGFWMQLYVNFYKKLWNEGMFESFSYYLLRPSDVEEYEKLVKKNEKQIKAFSDWGTKTIEEYFTNIPLEVNGEKITGTRLSQQGNYNGIAGIGTVKNGIITGCWYYFHHSGALKGHGCYNDQGKKSGRWHWYNTYGQIEQIYDTKDGYYHGIFEEYNNLGTLDSKINYNEGKKEGLYQEYHKRGGVSVEANYSNEYINGNVKFYHENGAVKYDYQVKDDKVDGTFREYYPNGALKMVTNYILNKKDSISVEYFTNGQAESSFTYKLGVLEGPYSSFFMDGSPYKEGTYKNGHLTGVQKEYFKNGKISELSNYDEEGKENGLMTDYDQDGIKYRELDYKKGNVVGYRIFDKQGKIVKEGYKKGGEFVYDALSPTGNKQTYGVYDIKGGKKGEWKFYDENGVLTEVSVYRDGVIQDTRTRYYSSGTVESTTEYKDGNWNGIYEEFYPSGKKSEEGYGIEGEVAGPYFRFSITGDTTEEEFYVNGMQQGRQWSYNNNGKPDRLYYYDEDLLIKEILMDTNGVPYDTLDMRNLSDTVEIYYPNGKLYHRAVFVNGVRQGKSEWFYGNGQLWTSANYVNNYKDGEYIYYHPNGKTDYVYRYELGVLQGNAELYYDNGTKREDRYYNSGYMDGKCVEYSEEGNIAGKYEYAYGKFHGKRYFYDPNGITDHIRHYFYGRIIGFSYLGKDGKEVEMIPIENETGEVKSYFSNGNVSRTYQLNKGTFEGKYTEYYENGKLSEEVTYVNGLMQGERTDYYDNGQVKQLLTYLDDEVNGKKTEYYRNGKIKTEGNYLSGERDGTWKYYDASGKLVKTCFYYAGLLLEEQ